MTREVPLSRGLVALVDDADFDRVVAVGRWYADRNGGQFYARRNYWTADRRYRSLKMHTFITGLPYVDHVNGDGLDNRRSNLRPATDRENSWNRPVRSDSATGFKGVHPKGGRFVVRIQRDGRRRHVGTYPTVEEAARAYDAAALELFGAFAHLNFPIREDESA